MIDARAVVGEAVAAARDRFAKRKVELSIDLDEQPVMIEADPARFQQIVVNLLDNASKHNRAEGPLEAGFDEHVVKPMDP